MPKPQPFPRGSRYIEALQNTSACFEDSDLRGSIPEAGLYGLPRGISGNTAIVFALAGARGGCTYVKCFTRAESSQEHRYREISRHFATLDSEPVPQAWRMNFSYLAKGILVSGNWFPILKMDKVEGLDLCRWLEENHHDSSAVSDVAANFLSLAENLHAAHIAHGDLQHGNILVAPDRTLHLVDYDGMFVPSLSDIPSTEIGHRNYQSPLRSRSDYGLEMDNFSSWVIYAALISLAADPSLWMQLHKPQEEYLLLSSEDFCEPHTSARFMLLKRHADSLVREITSHLFEMASQPLGSIPRLTAVSNSGSGVPLHLTRNGDDLLARTSVGRPEWLYGNQPSTRTSKSGLLKDAPQDYQGRGSIETILTALFPICMVCTLLLSAEGPLSLRLGIGMCIAILGSALAAATFGYRSRSELQSINTALHGVDQLLEISKRSLIDYERLAAEIHQIDKDREDLLHELAAAQEELTQELHRTCALIESERIANSAPFDEELASCAAGEQAALTKALYPFQEPWITQEIRKRQIRGARLQGFSRNICDALAEHGLQTAADFTGIRIIGYSRALIVRSDGTETRVPGVGLQRARSLEGWRNYCIGEARKSCPTTVKLPQSQFARISAPFEERKESLRAAKRNLDETALAKRQAKTVITAARRAELLDEHQVALEVLGLQHQQTEARLLGSRKTALEQNSLEYARASLVSRVNRLSFVRYLFFLYGIR